MRPERLPWWAKIPVAVAILAVLAVALVTVEYSFIPPY